MASPGHPHQHVSLGNPGDLRWIKISENKIKLNSRERERFDQRKSPSYVNEIKIARTDTNRDQMQE